MDKGAGDSSKFKIYDSVFTHMLKIPKYLLEFHLALCPEDAPLREEDIRIITVSNAITTGVFNDLGYIVGDSLMVLTEAQTAWSYNMPMRMLHYYSRTMNEQETVSGQSVWEYAPMRIPKPKFFVIYTGDRKRRQAHLSLADTYFGGDASSIDLKVTMVYGGRGGDIIDQYIEFSRIVKEHYKKGRSEEALWDAVRECIDSNILKEYLLSRGGEVVNMKSTELYFSQETERYLRYKEQKIEKKLEQKYRAAETKLRAEETKLRAEETKLRAEETKLRAEAKASTLDMLVRIGKLSREEADQLRTMDDADIK